MQTHYVQTKRVHEFATNVMNNEAVAKKSGRTMSTKTRHRRKTGQYKRNAKIIDKVKDIYISVG